MTSKAIAAIIKIVPVSIRELAVTGLTGAAKMYSNPITIRMTNNITLQTFNAGFLSLIITLYTQ